MTSRKHLVIGFIGSLIFFGCSVHTSERKDATGKSENVDIHTPFGSISVNESSADAKDTGLQLYPGARPRTDSRDNKHSADVNLSSSTMGVKVVAREYQSDDSPDKVLAYYRKQLDKYGNVIQCSGHFNDSGFTYRNRDFDAPVSCNGSTGNKAEQTLKAGTESNQHVVAVKPSGNGSEFTLVYVRLWNGKQSM